MGQEEGRLAEQQGGTSRWGIALDIVLEIIYVCYGSTCRDKRIRRW